MVRSGHAISLLLVLTACGALGYGLWALAEGSDLAALYALITGGLALAAANDRERFLAAR
jgi:hypothetical protein